MNFSRWFFWRGIWNFNDFISKTWFLWGTSMFPPFLLSAFLLLTRAGKSSDDPELVWLPVVWKAYILRLQNTFPWKSIRIFFWNVRTWIEKICIFINYFKNSNYQFTKLDALNKLILSVTIEWIINRWKKLSGNKRKNKCINK